MKAALIHPVKKHLCIPDSYDSFLSSDVLQISEQEYLQYLKLFYLLFLEHNLSTPQACRINFLFKNI